MSMGYHPTCDIQSRLANVSCTRSWRLCGISPAIYFLLYVCSSVSQTKLV